MIQMNEKSLMVRKLTGKLYDMSDRLEGKSKKQFLYKKIDVNRIEEEDFVEDLLIMRYILEKKLKGHDLILMNKIKQHETALIVAIREGMSEKIKYNEEIERAIDEEIVPYYHTRFNISLSREISFLPLELRLMIYTRLLEFETNTTARYHLLDRLSLTLYKANKSALGEYSVFLKCIDGVYANLVQTEDCLVLVNGKTVLRGFAKWYEHEIEENLTAANLREEIFNEALLPPEIAGRDFWYGFKGFSDLERITDIDAARVCLRLFSLYYKKSFLIMDSIETEILNYYRTKNYKSIQKLLEREQLNELSINAKYIINSEEGTNRQMDSIEIKKYEKALKRTAQIHATIHKNRSLININKKSLDISILIVPEKVDKIHILKYLPRFINALENHSYTLLQFDTYVCDLILATSWPKLWSASDLNLVWGMLIEARAMLWVGNRKDTIRVLRILVDIIDERKGEVRPNEGWPLAIAVSDRRISKEEKYFIMSEVESRFYIFASIVFVSDKDSHVLKSRDVKLEKAWLRKLCVVSSDKSNFFKKMGVSKKELKRLNDRISEMMCEKNKSFSKINTSKS